MNDASSPESGDSPPSLELLIHEHGQCRRVGVPSGGTIVIGRSGSSDVRLEDGSISRQHAALHLGSFEVEDLGSKNGSSLFPLRPDVTWQAVVDGFDEEAVELAPGVRYRVEPGAVLKLGNVVVGLAHVTPASRTEPIRAEARVAKEEVVLADSKMLEIHEQAGRAAATALPVLVLGETGVGKRIVAEHIHRASPRSAGPFVRVNCGGLSAALLESELFGYEPGAFPGATETKPGLIELAHGGTVFLDEIGELAPSTQAQLLRVIESGAVTRLGGTRSRLVDVRLVTTTHRDLVREIQRGRFRKDLYFRINSVCLTVPPLRERRAEIEPLSRLFLQSFCEENGLDEPELSAAAERHLLAYSWPGNVRELRNAMERAAILCPAGRILPAHLPAESELTAVHRIDLHPAPDAWPDEEETTSQALDVAPGASAADDQRVAEALRVCGGNQTRAAKLLGISRRTLVNRLNEYQLPRPRKRVI